MAAADLHDRAAARLRATQEPFTSGRALVGQLDELAGSTTIQDDLRPPRTTWPGQVER